MQTTMLWSAGVFSTATRWSPTRLSWPSARDRLGGVREQRLLERRIAPGLGDDAGAVVRTDLGLVGLDDEVERGRIDVALLGQDRLERAHAQLRLRELRAVLVVDGRRGRDRVLHGNANLLRLCHHSAERAVAVILLVAGAVDEILAQGGPVRRAASAKRAASRGRWGARLGVRQAGGILPRAVGRDPRRQGRRQRGLDPVRHLFPVRRVPCGRARSWQGGDLVLPGGQRRDLAAWRGAVVRLRAAAGAGGGGDRRHRGGAVERDGRHDETCSRRHRDRQLCAHHPDRPATALGEGARLHHDLADAAPSRRGRRRRHAGAPPP